MEILWYTADQLKRFYMTLMFIFNSLLFYQSKDEFLYIIQYTVVIITCSNCVEKPKVLSTVFIIQFVLKSYSFFY